jgi:capsule biosynthesis phosphatase
MISTYVIDVDGTICFAEKLENGTYDYQNATPFRDVIDKINQLYKSGHKIILFTARGMRTYQKNLEKIHENVKPILVNWLLKNGVNYDELIFGKPWGETVYYIDNRNLSLNSFVNQHSDNFEEIVRKENSL